MKTIKILFLTFVLVFISTVFSCIFGPQKSDTYYYDITDFKINTKKRTSLNHPNSCFYLVKEIQDSVRFDSFLILLKDIPPQVVNYNSINFFKDKNVFANMGPQYFPRGNISVLNIFSNTKYDDNHDKGVLLNDIFRACIVGEIENSLMLSEISFETPKCGNSIQICIESPPYKTTKHSFTIQYKETDGTEIIIKTDTILITP